MLVLSRKKGEQLLIADNISVTVVEIRGDKVRLGIEAPEEVPVNRREVALMKRSTPEQKAKIRRLRAAGVPLHRIEQTLDQEENQ